MNAHSEKFKNVWIMLITTTRFEFLCLKNTTCANCANDFSIIWIFLSEKLKNMQTMLVASVWFQKHEWNLDGYVWGMAQDQANETFKLGQLIQSHRLKVAYTKRSVTFQLKNKTWKYIQQTYINTFTRKKKKKTSFINFFEDVAWLQKWFQSSYRQQTTMVQQVDLHQSS